MARISVFGIGYVGAVAAACLARDGHKVIAVDTDETKVDLINRGQSPLVETGLGNLIAQGIDSDRLFATSDASFAIDQTDVSFICVGTPSDPSGALDLTFIKEVSRQIGQELRDKDTMHSVVLRSTVLPGTSDDVCLPLIERHAGKTAGRGFGFGYYPEFLREGSAIEDYDDAGLVVFGALDEATRNFLHMLNATQDCCLHEVGLRTAEMVKYTSNSWRATKVTFANEIGNIAKACGLDGHEVMDILCADHKVSMSPKFLRPGFAFGGSCLPKDIRALKHLADRTQTPTPLLSAVLDANDAQVLRAERMVRESGAHHVGLVGVSFKPGTDDLRESPLVDLAARLLGQGINVSIYDPFVARIAQEQGEDRFRKSKLPQLKHMLVQDLADLVNEADALVIGNFYAETVEILREASVTKPTIDLTRLRRDMVSTGTYEGICW
ncbi:nucleotide sugar dehydrogenase [Cognatishimia sp.]|uniref:nucleotide sugar dehydrogenase n=1 Tax=Cognatishimia sp. TaxID=2211648 RepID=UPI0035189EF3